jgi:hypothetical protein
MKSLGKVADQQTPALQQLDATAPQLTRFLDLLAPFAQASRPAIRSLGHASITGDKAARAAAPTVQLLNGVAAGTPEAAKDLSIVLQHLDDRKNAIEKDPRSPGGQGYTGLEALLQYVYDQTLSTSVYDQNSHIFKVALFASKCANYADVDALKKDPSLATECGSYLGPSQPGITMPDVTKFDDPNSDTAKRIANHRNDPTPKPPPAPSLPVPTPKLPAAPTEPAPAAPQAPGVGGAVPAKPPAVKVPAVPKVPPAPGVPQVPNVPLPCIPPLVPPACDPNIKPGAAPPSAPVQVPPLPGTGSSASQQQQQTQLLDYLLKP